jgi:hypothetical protein
VIAAHAEIVSRNQREQRIQRRARQRDVLRDHGLSMTNATVIDSFIEDGNDGVAIKDQFRRGFQHHHQGQLVPRHPRQVDRQPDVSRAHQRALDEQHPIWERQWGNVSADDNGINIKSDPERGAPFSR